MLNAKGKRIKSDAHLSRKSGKTAEENGFKNGRLLAAISALEKWEDPSYNDLEIKTFIDYSRGNARANFERDFVSLKDFNRVCDFILSIKRKLGLPFIRR